MKKNSKRQFLKGVIGTVKSAAKEGVKKLKEMKLPEITEEDITGCEEKLTELREDIKEKAEHGKKILTEKINEFSSDKIKVNKEEKEVSVEIFLEILNRWKINWEDEYNIDFHCSGLSPNEEIITKITSLDKTETLIEAVITLSNTPTINAIHGTINKWDKLLKEKIENIEPNIKSEVKKENRMKIFICGAKGEGEVANFNKASEMLTKLGFEVFNPLENFPIFEEEHNRIKYNSYCLANLMECDAIYKLRGCFESKSGIVESTVANTLGLYSFTEGNFNNEYKHFLYVRDKSKYLLKID